MQYLVDVYDANHTQWVSTYKKCGRMFNADFWQSLEFQEICKNYNKFVSSTVIFDLGCTRDFRYNVRYLQKNLILLPFVKFVCIIMKISLYEYLKLGLASFDILQQASLNRDRFKIKG